MKTINIKKITAHLPRRPHTRRAGLAAMALLIIFSTLAYSFLFRAPGVKAAVCQPTIAADSATIGTRTWVSPQNALIQDGASATTGDGTSHYLVITGCNLSIPIETTITGVRVDFYRIGDLSNDITDNSVRLVKNGVIQTTDRSTGTAWDNNVYRWDSYGGATDLWGTTLTTNDVSGSNFGVAISAKPSTGVGLYGIDSTHITIYYPTNSAPDSPILSAPASGATGVSKTQQFQFKATDADGDYLRYDIELYESDCEEPVWNSIQSLDQTGWSGQDQQAGTAYTGGSTLGGSTMAVFTFPVEIIDYGTTYCWKARAIDPGGSNTWISYSATQLFTTVPDNIPAAPTLFQPADAATDASLTPSFQLKSTDSDGDYLRYKLDICSTSDCSSIVRTVDQNTGGQTGWSGQDTEGGLGYTGGATLDTSTMATYTYQLPALNPETQYWWRGYAIDANVGFTYSQPSAIHSFTTRASAPVIINGGVNIRGGSHIGN